MLVLEDAIEAEGIVEFNPTGTLFGTSVSQLVGKLGRTVISHKDEKYRVFRDQSVYRELNHRVFADFWILRIPIWKWTNNRGLLSRDIYTLDPKKRDPVAVEEAMDRFMRTNDESFLEPLAERSDLDTHYRLNRRRLNLLSVYRFRAIQRVDNITLAERDADGLVQETRERFQVSILSLTEWAVLGNAHESKDIKLTAKVESDGKLDNVRAEVKLTIFDRATTSRDLRTRYIPMLTTLAQDPQFISFTPELHSTNNKWGETLSEALLVYHQRAIRKVLGLSDAELWQRLSQITGVPLAELQWRPSASPRTHHHRSEHPLGARLRQVIAQLRKARALGADKERMRVFAQLLNTAVWKRSGSYETTLLAVFNSFLADRDYFIKGLITQVPDKENKFPARLPLYNEKGDALNLRYPYMDFDFTDVKTAWEIF